MTVLHVGCAADPLPDWFADRDEIRLDIDPRQKPDIVASVLDMRDVGRQVDIVYSCHMLEHLYPDEVPHAIEEMKRVLKPGGSVIVVVPDLEGVKPTEETVYESKSGPICGLDMFYGHAAAVAGSRYWAHHCGFIKSTLQGVFEKAGFSRCEVSRYPICNLMALGVK